MKRKLRPNWANVPEEERIRRMSETGKKAWDGISPKERSRIMSERRKKGLSTVVAPKAK